MGDIKGSKKRGRPPGTPGGGKYDCPTKVVRVPESYAPKIEKLLCNFEGIKSCLDDWKLRAQDARKESGSGELSPRWERCMEMIGELEEYLDL